MYINKLENLDEIYYFLKITKLAKRVSKPKMAYKRLKCFAMRITEWRKNVEEKDTNKNQGQKIANTNEYSRC